MGVKLLRGAMGSPICVASLVPQAPNSMETCLDFEVLIKSYKEVHGHQILTNILIPKSTPEGEHPVIINWHGGAVPWYDPIFVFTSQD